MPIAKGGDVIERVFGKLGKKTTQIFRKAQDLYVAEDDFYKIYIDFPRDRLIKRIHARTTDMINGGAIMEVKKFLKLKIQSSKTAYKAIGIQEIKEFLNKKLPNFTVLLSEQNINPVNYY